MKAGDAKPPTRSPVPSALLDAAHFCAKTPTSDREEMGAVSFLNQLDASVSIAPV